MILVHANEATAAQRQVYFHLVDATDGITAETGEAGGQPQISTMGAAWTSTGIGTLTAIGNGRYYAVLTQAAVATAGDVIETRYKSGNTAECPGTTVQVVSFDPAGAYYDNLSNISAGGNTFRTPFQDGVITIPQTQTWTGLTAITISQDGGNWGDLSGYTITLSLSIAPKYTNHASYVPTNHASFSFTGSASGSNPSQTLTFSPGTTTTNLFPTQPEQGFGAYPYRAQAWAVSGTNQRLLFSGFADVTDDVRS